MYRFKDYLKEEIIPDAEHPILSFLKCILKKGPSNAMFLFRMMYVTNTKHNLLAKIICFICENKLIKNYNTYISREAEIDIGFRMGHPNGIVIGKGVKIGKNCIIYHQVTFGSKKFTDDIKSDTYPTIQDNCIFYPGSKVIGNLTVASKTVLAANAVLLESTYPNGVYVGIPARRIVYE